MAIESSVTFPLRFFKRASVLAERSKARVYERCNRAAAEDPLITRHQHRWSLRGSKRATQSLENDSRIVRELNRSRGYQTFRNDPKIQTCLIVVASSACKYFISGLLSLAAMLDMSVSYKYSHLDTLDNNK